MALLECVANVSEGRNKEVIDQIAQAIRAVDKVILLHTDTGQAAHRTVYTFAGEPSAVMEAAFQMYQSAKELINMELHQGTHPRQGAVDVCPFIPLGGINTEDVVLLVKRFGERIAHELGIGGYFYAMNAGSKTQASLATQRRGQYEALPAKLREHPLDFGTEQHWASFGVTVIGCRKLLVAYNVNLSTRQATVAHQIASKVRSSGYLQKSKEGHLEHVKGALGSVMGLGWYINEFGMAQTSYNLTDLTESGILEVFETTKKVAQEHSVQVLGSELVGLAPYSEFKKIAQHLRPSYKWQDAELLLAVEDYLGLSSVKDFDPLNQILDFQLNQVVDIYNLS